MVDDFNRDRIVKETNKQYRIEWKFNPPAAPHFGGVFEAMIKAAKRALRSILGNADVTDEEPHTAICGAESLLNSRPITYVSADVNDLTPLTPNHFLCQLGGRFAPEALNDTAINPRKRWHRIQQLLSQFWKRWQRELLPTLNSRKKWFQERRNLQKGDVVLVIEPHASRREWPLGRITETYPGADGLVRVVKVRYGGREYLRPISRLCPLEYVDQDE